MPNTIENPVYSLMDKLNNQYLLITESLDKVTIHLQLLNSDLSRTGLNSNYHTHKTRITHLEKVEVNLISSLHFIDDLRNKLGGFYNVGNSR